MEAKLNDPASQLQRLKASEDYKYSQLVDLRTVVKKEDAVFEETSKPLSEAIRQLGTWREEWLAEKKRWSEWQSALLEKEGGDQLTSTFDKANDTIDKALNLVFSPLEAMLTVQEKAGTVQTKIKALSAELDGLISEERRGVLVGASPPMFSSRYFSQFKSREMWLAAKHSLHEISWPDRQFFAQQGWIVLLQGLLTLVVIIAVYRNRQVLSESAGWRFLAARPFSTGFFLATMTTLLIFQYEGVPAVCKLAAEIVAAVSFVRLSGAWIEASWKRQFVYGVMIILIVTRIMDVLSFPLPLVRLYTALTALVGILFCFRWSGESGRHKDSGLYIWSLRLLSLFFAVIIIAELWGKKALATHLYFSLIDSIATVLVFLLLMYMIRGGLIWLFRTSLLRRVAVLHSDDVDAIVRGVARFIDLAIWGLVLLPAILMIWGVYNTLEEATKGLLALGFNVGSQRISVGLVIASAAILYASFLASRILRKLLMDEVLVRRQMEKGVRHAIGRLVHYVLIFVGFLFALSTLGLDFTKLTIMLSALGVGIGFGLQGIVNNFVSGLILLFERPVRVGDYVELGGQWSEIKRIGLRATTVRTFDEAEVTIPNADLVSNQVTNWTLSSRLVRLIIPVGVAYGSDVPLVIETLMTCATTNPDVVKRPAPQILFLSFGESSLDFELRVWVSDVDQRLWVKSALHQEIDRRFREANIEIAFPQRDLHLRSADESAILRHAETAG
jgi:small-conductance mechanosensitive channel